MVMAAPRLLSSMTLPLGDGLISATRWRDGTATVVAEGRHTEESAADVAVKLRALARFVEPMTGEGR